LSRPKILILTPGLGTGGAQKVFKEQLLFYSEHFAATGCIFNWDGALNDEKGLTVLSLDVPAGNHWISKFYFFCKRIARLRAIKKKLKFDVSISHLEGADYVNILSNRGEKIICYIHGTKLHDGAIEGVLGWIRKKILMPYLYRKVDLIIGVSDGIRNEFLGQFETSSNKIKVITNGLDLKMIEKQALETVPAQHKLLFENHKTICLCSRLAPQKNQEIFLSIFAQLKVASCKLIILGDGELRANLIEQSKRLGLRVYNIWGDIQFSNDFDVYFLGNLTNPFRYISKCSLFALPSSWEGFPLALGEAMACGVPVVASDCPTGPREILRDADNSEYGFLLPIPVKNVDAALQLWRQTLMNILTNKALAIDYAEKARRRIKNFGKEGMETAWLEIVKNNQ